jgi:ribosomal protein S20
MKKFKELREGYLEEKLKASDPAGTYIHDFVHSDNPKFAGKSKAKRIQMALAASYGAKGKSKNEEVEEMDEEKTMSRAAKGYEKYGKEGMTKLSQEAQKGASEKKMDAIRDKYNKYDESVMTAVKTMAKKATKALTGGSDQDQLKNLQKKMGVPQTGKKPTSK